SPRRVAEECLARLSGLLQARGDVDRIAGRAAAAGPRVADDDLARVHADPHLKLKAAFLAERTVELRQLAAHVHGRPNGAQGVVLVEGWDAEDGDHRVPDELLDRAAVALEDLAHGLEETAHDRPQRFGVETLAEPRRAGDVGEHDGHDLARLPGRLSRRERLRAVHAEPRALGIRGAAVGACDHALSLRFEDRDATLTGRPETQLGAAPLRTRRRGVGSARTRYLKWKLC